MNNQMKYGVVGVLVGGFIVWSFMSFIGASPKVGMMGRQFTTQSTKNSDTLDAHFIEQMIPHHEDAITMAKLAQTRAKTPEVKQLAENIISSQSKEITQMKNWYKEWFGKDVPTGIVVMGQHGMMGNSNSMHMGMAGDESDVTRLTEAEDFDRAFVEDMIPHHQMAVMMANMLKGGTQREEMKTLAEDIVTAQTKEINQMREWLKNW
jgi:uncharacterized protein (DUF305 family)